jgi:hypothetical protein
VNDGLSFARRMCTSFFHDESRRLTCQVVRLDDGLFVGYGVDLGRAVSAAGPRALSSAAAPCEVDGFYWTVLVPDIVNSGREEQGSVSV